MKVSTLAPNDFHENPELAVIEILESSLDMTTLAFIASYPDIYDTEADNHGGDYSERMAYADCLMNQVQALEMAIAGYRSCLERQEQRMLFREQSQKKNIIF